MIASLYQSFMAERDDVGDADLRVQPHVVPLAAPEVGLVGQQIVRCDGGVERPIPGGERQLDMTVLHVERIEVDYHEYRIAPVRRPLRITDELGVIGLLKLEMPVEMQSRVLTADRIHPTDELLQAVRAVEGARLDLVLL